MADRDISTFTATDIQSWFDQATPDQAIRALQPVLDKVADYPQAQRDELVQQMSSRTRKLFEGQPVS
jgi:hypothetical protein